MLMGCIDDVFINLIGDDIAVVLDDNICYRLEFLTGKHLAARISSANPSSLKLAKDLGIEVFLIDSQEEDGPDLN